MYLLTFVVNEYADGTGKWIPKQLGFSDKGQMLKTKAEYTNKSVYRNVKAYTELLDENIDYKEKFEELYDFILTGAGVRKVDVNKKVVI